ncbi:DUF4837 family protein [Flammeovirga sp. MY04]|uniref:DUF4837 family protein n=1 Tax=Flammeovirga sp. MY04 TaxID=1191459 RepID=UPI000806085B|nr:DUF4837 family protein [Flammeovirga sp. MY04]ANQ48927.1 DUF4837 family protein [Flammeovirga sp. MY04]
MKKIFLYLTYISFSLLCLSSCLDNSGAKTETEKSFLPSSKGKPGEMVLVIDSTQWGTKASIGGQLYTKVLGATRGILPQSEPQFTVTQVQPSGFNSILRQARNVMIVTTFDNKGRESRILKSFFGEGVIEALSKDPEKYYYVKKDVWAKGQTVMLFFAESEEKMAKVLEDPNKTYYLTQPFHDIENKRLAERITKERDRKITRFLKDKYNVDISLLQGYKIAKSEEDFLWLRHPEIAFDNNIILMKMPYTDEKQFDADHILKFRNELAKKYLYGNPEDKESFVITESKVKPEIKNAKIDGRQAVEIRGLWRTNTYSMGGPFISYLFTDKSGANLYYLEGFVYAPSMDKRELMRDMEAQLKTFKDF